MNQILVSKKVYVTKEMRRKQKIYRALYIISVITVLILVVYYIYAEKNRDDQEGLSHEILAQINSDNTTVSEKTIVVALDNNNDDSEVIPIEETQPTANETINEVTTSNGTYTAEAVFTYSKLGISYPVLSEESDELLKVSLCNYWGPKPNEVGNYCIVGHNYKSGKMFGKLSQSAIGDQVTLKDISTGTIVTYSIYNRYVVKPTDVSCTSQRTNGKRELTLITCTNYGQERLVVKAREI